MTTIFLSLLPAAKIRQNIDKTKENTKIFVFFSIRHLPAVYQYV